MLSRTASANFLRKLLVYFREIISSSPCLRSKPCLPFFRSWYQIATMKERSTVAERSFAYTVFSVVFREELNLTLSFHFRKFLIDLKEKEQSSL